MVCNMKNQGSIHWSRDRGRVVRLSMPAFARALGAGIPVGFSSMRALAPFVSCRPISQFTLGVGWHWLPGDGLASPLRVVVVAPAPSGELPADNKKRFPQPVSHAPFSLSSDHTHTCFAAERGCAGGCGANRAHAQRRSSCDAVAFPSGYYPRFTASV